ncbi:MAG: hypothetical protein FWD28_06625 [Treponema sp.]|nr:hypothetical protein [Treponema sp.]
MIYKCWIVPAVFLLSIINIFSLEITERDLEAYIRGEYNRSSNYYGEISIVGALELQNHFKIRGGFAYGKNMHNTDINSFINTKYSPFSGIPLGFSVSYIYNSFPEYSTHTHSLLPLISFNGERAGITAGVNFRFTSFFYESPILETILSLHTYFNFIITDTLRIGMGFGNISDFMAKNLSAYSVSFYVSILFFENWSLINEVEFMQSGGDGLSTTFYGFSWRGGVKFSW